MCASVPQTRDIAFDCFGDGDLVNPGTGIEDGLLRDDLGLRGAPRLLCLLAAHEAHYFEFVGIARIPHHDVLEKAIALRLGQGIRALLLDRVLRRQHHEQLGQLVCFSGDRYLPLFHGFEQGRLHLGRGAVDFIGEGQIAKDRPRLELETAPTIFVVVDFGAGSVRQQQVGCELDAPKLGLQIAGEALDRTRFGESGQTFQRRLPFASSVSSKRSMTCSWPIIDSPMCCFSWRILVSSGHNIPPL